MSWRGRFWPSNSTGRLQSWQGIPTTEDIDRIAKTDAMTEARQGLILINTGPGKGKTTAAMGTALRAVGNGLKVLMLQFLKGSWHYGELDAVEAFQGNFVLRQMGRGFVKIGGAATAPEDLRLGEGG